MDYDQFDKQAFKLVKNLFEQIKNKTIKKDGLLANDNYIVSISFYECFNDNINLKKKNWVCVGFIHIDTKDLEKHRNYDECISGGISELEWKQEK